MLNLSQKEAVLHVRGPLLILAGAGAGKTHTLTERIGHMVAEGIAPSSILAVTFTNKAAKEMRERIGKKLGCDFPVNPYQSRSTPLVGTFHSIGVYFLRLFADEVGLSKDFTIFDEDDRIRVVREALKESNVDDKQATPKQILGMISQAKNAGYTPKEYARNASSTIESLVARVFELYERRMAAVAAIDFDDILIKTLELLRKENVREHFWNRFEYFLVDEYQDTNDIQYQMVKILAAKHRNLCVVGDDWQGIYSWRGANIQNILSFERDYPDAKVVKLEQNYRSTKTVIAAANAVVKHNSEALEKTLWTDNPQGEKIRFLECVDDREESRRIAETIDDSEEKLGEWAILYRTNSQSRLLEEALIRKGIRYRVFGGVKFYERREIKDILSYIRLIFNPFDTVSLSRIINVPARKIGDKTLSVLLDYLHNYGMSFQELASHLEDVEELPAIGRKAVIEFGAIYLSLMEFAAEHSVKELMEHLVKKIDYEGYLKTFCASDEEIEDRKANLVEFANMASRYDGLEPKEGMSLFLQDIALITDMDEEKESANDVVSLMTIHLSKGLEFGNVIIAGSEEGLFPHSRSLFEPKALEEERRLMYVAMTRAKRQLFIVRAMERYTFGNFSANPPSRFLKEIPEECVEVVPYERKEYFGRLTGGGGGVSFAGTSTGTSSGVSTSGNSSVPSGQFASVRRSISANDPSAFSLGMRVRHVQFGVGTIVSLSGEIGEIAFPPPYGIKKLSLKLAPIEPLS